MNEPSFPCWLTVTTPAFRRSVWCVSKDDAVQKLAAFSMEWKDQLTEEQLEQYFGAHDRAGNGYALRRARYLAMTECFYGDGPIGDEPAVYGANVVAHRRCVRARMAVGCNPPMSNIDDDESAANRSRAGERKREWWIGHKRGLLR